MGGRVWTKRELQFLDENADRMSAAQMAKRLHRTRSAVIIKMGRLGIRSFKHSTDLLAANRICEMLGVQSRTVKNWEKHGLEMKDFHSMHVAEQRVLLKFLKEHPDLWNAKRVRNDALFCNQAWYAEKRKTDKEPASLWTDLEIVKAQKLYRKGMRIADIAENVGRSERGVADKIRWMRKKGMIW